MTTQIQPDVFPVELGSVIRPFTATLPDNSVFRGSIVTTRAEFGDLSENDLRDIAEQRAADHWTWVSDPENARAIQDARELVDLIESLCDPSQPEWVQTAVQGSERSGQLLATLAGQVEDGGQEFGTAVLGYVQERAEDATFGPLWAGFLGQF